MRSNFTAFRALVYSRARSKGCCAGSRFRLCFVTVVPGACCDDAERDSALIFMASYLRTDYFIVAHRLSKEQLVDIKKSFGGEDVGCWRRATSVSSPHPRISYLPTIVLTKNPSSEANELQL